MDKVFTDKSSCCGCTACANICSRNAITMKADEAGFLYPEIDQKLCIDCGMCKKVCAFQNGYALTGERTAQKVYAMKSLNDAERGLSSSGGAFPALGRAFLNKGGVIYGSALDNNFETVHVRITKTDDLPALQGSKYVQSRLADTFSNVKNDLENGISVMFTGTGCQVQGLREFLRKDYDNLTLVDIVCHGAPSPKVFADYAELMQKKYNSKISRIDFRGKRIYSETQDMYIEFENGKTYSEFPNIDVFISLFSKNLTIRPSCSKCVYTNTKRPGDITLGDFWGIRKLMPEFDDKRGISLLITNTKKGEDLTREILSEFDYRETALEDALQPNLREPTKLNPAYNEFWHDYKNNGICYVYKKYSGVTTGFKIKRRVKNKVKRILKK